MAGDTLRSCADLDLPVIGITLFYKKGHFKQRIDSNGNQIEEEVAWDPGKLLEPLPNKVTVNIDRRDVEVRAWLYRLKGFTGHTNHILFLDTDLPENSAYDRTITHYLYFRQFSPSGINYPGN